MERGLSASEDSTLGPVPSLSRYLLPGPSFFPRPCGHLPNTPTSLTNTLHPQLLKSLPPSFHKIQGPEGCLAGLETLSESTASSCLQAS